MENSTNLIPAYIKRKKQLESELEKTSSDVLKREINKSLTYIDIAIAAHSDLCITVPKILASYLPKKTQYDNEVSSLIIELQCIVDKVPQADDGEKTLLLLKYNAIDIKIKSTHSKQDIEMSKLKIINTFSLFLLEILTTILDEPSRDLFIKKLKIIIRYGVSQVPILGTSLDILTTFTDLLYLNIKNARNTDEYLCSLDSFNKALEIYIFSAVSFNFESKNMFDDESLPSIPEKEKKIKDHYQSVIAGGHWIQEPKSIK